MLSLRTHIRRWAPLPQANPPRLPSAGRCLPETARRSLGRIG